VDGSALVGAALASVPGVAWAATCPEGQTRCGDRCGYLQNNERHCGSCRNRCQGQGEEGDECVAGMCQGGGEPMCGPNPPCPEGQECVQELCRPVSTPSCPEGVCFCAISGDGSGNVCIAFSAGDDVVSSCDQCPTNTVCYDVSPSPDVTILACGEPCL
jgi:hypothetical protein